MSVESLADRIAKQITDVATLTDADRLAEIARRKEATDRLRDLLVEFAEEIKREAIEP